MGQLHSSKRGGSSGDKWASWRHPSGHPGSQMGTTYSRSIDLAAKPNQSQQIKVFDTLTIDLSKARHIHSRAIEQRKQFYNIQNII